MSKQHNKKAEAEAKRELLMEWLRERKKYLNISEIARDCGFHNLHAALNRGTSGAGYEVKLPLRRVPDLERVLNSIIK